MGKVGQGDNGGLPPCRRPSHKPSCRRPGGLRGTESPVGDYGGRSPLWGITGDGVPCAVGGVLRGFTPVP